MFLYAYSVAKEASSFYVIKNNELLLFLFYKPRKGRNIQRYGIAKYPWIEAGLPGNPLQPVLQRILMDAEDPGCFLDGQILLIIDLEQMDVTVRQMMANIPAVAAAHGPVQTLQ